MNKIGKRLRTLREGIGFSQEKLASILGSTQSCLNRYESGQSTPSVELFRKYADYFDVSMDYIFARCDEPQGKIYENKTPLPNNNPELANFIEMCFDPKSPMNEKLKKTLTQMLSESQNK